MTQQTIFLCPGQGAQIVGMGRDWYQTSTAARETFDEADAILAGSLPKPLSALCFEGPADLLNRTDISQPAIYACSIACHRALVETRGSDFALAAAAGLSLGEYTALTLARAFLFEHGLRLVALRGQAMQQAAEALSSTMVALIGADEEKANALCDAARGGEVLVAANFNAPGQVVISGTLAACERAEQLAPEHGLRATRLQVAGAFHSPLMQPAADRLAEALENTPISTPRCPVMSNVTGEAHDPEPAAIRKRLVEQLTSPVRWAANCERLAAGHADAEWHELAPGKSLAGMMRRIDKGVKVITHDTPETSNA
ncbi:MAG: ACP S-malonyltransferase [Phycisphaerales bacterium]|nr:ACP S-malonyltransferase [Planctomycetota bacterium]MCH8508911.1 ACP S-malonyltransferase [Phycisphaerales bacterium]